MRRQAWDAVEAGPVSSGMAKQKAVRRQKEAEEELKGTPDHIHSSLAHQTPHPHGAPLLIVGRPSCSSSHVPHLTRVHRMR